MKTEDLKSQGLTDEQIKFIMAENGKDIAVEQAKITAETEKLTKANGTITQLQDTVKKFDGVDVDKLKGDLTALETKYNTDLSATKLNSALEMALVTGKAKNTKAVKALLDMESIKLDGDKLLGLDDQLTKLKTDSSYLFEEVKSDTTVKVDSGGDHQGELGGDTDKFFSAARAAAGLSSDDTK